MNEFDGENDGASILTWTRLIMVTVVSFWCQAVVTEERLVPALNVIAERFKIPDDIVGATFMAAGASSPELFTSFVSLFVTHSAMGMGTIVGSEIFNQLVICAGAVYASNSGKLLLDRKIVFREVGFYGLSILLLYIALQDVREVPLTNEITDAEDVELEERIFISFGGSFLIFSGYIAYVIVCANMKAVVSCFEKLPIFQYQALPKEDPLNQEAGIEHHNSQQGENEEGDFQDNDLAIEMITSKRSDDDDDILIPDPDTSIEEVVDQEVHVSHRRHSTLENGTTPPNPEQKDHHEDHHTSLVAFPTQSPEWQIMLYLFLLPLRYAMHFTIPDVQVPQRDASSNAATSRAYLSTFQCLVWLIMASYVMVTCLERIAALLNVPDSVVGVTISAAGTALPNYIASRIAAEKGLGNQAVSNAFGSNTFNIMVGLGLPWTLYTSFATGFEPYSDLRNDDIIESIVILAAVLVVFVVLMGMSDYVMYRWHGHLFAVMYAGYLGLVIFQNWDWDFRIEEAVVTMDELET